MLTRRLLIGGTLGLGASAWAPPPGVLISIEDSFNVSGVGVVAVGRVERGVVKVGDALELVGLGPSVRVTCRGIERFRQRQTEATMGQDVGLTLSGITREQVKRGQILAAPGAVRSVARFEAEIQMTASDAGGRRLPIADGHRPLVRVRNALVSAVVRPTGGSLAPGSKGRMTIELQEPLGLEVGTTLAFVEGGRAVASGAVTRLLAAPPRS